MPETTWFRSFLCLHVMCFPILPKQYHFSNDLYLFSWTDHCSNLIIYFDSQEAVGWYIFEAAANDRSNIVWLSWIRGVLTKKY
jgi:hypothetical protein